jgi:hypothetical protein
MARSASDREDLLREATALVERVELFVAGWDEPVVVGFRRDGAASVYFGSAPVYQFNTAGELRRAFIDGLLYKAERGRLVALSRERNEREVALVRSELTAEQTVAILAALHSHLSRLREALLQQAFTVSGQVPAESGVVSRTREWLETLPGAFAIACAPNVR